MYCSWVFVDINGRVLRAFDNESEFYDAYNQILHPMRSNNPKGGPPDPNHKIKVNARRKRERRASKKPLDVFISVDETGNIGARRKMEKHYVLVGCVVTDRLMFVKPIAKRYNGVEIKLNNSPKDAVPIMEESRQYVSNVYYVDFIKPDEPLSEEEQVQVHLDMVEKLVEGICEQEPNLSYSYLIDEKESVNNDKVYQRVMKASSKKNAKVADCKIDASSKHYELMANDFYTGAVGREINQNNFILTNVMRKDGFEPIKVHFSWTRKKKRGGILLPSHWRNTDHLQPFLGKVPPKVPQRTIHLHVDAINGPLTKTSPNSDLILSGN